MGAGGEPAGADYQRTGFPAGTGGDHKPPEEAQEWHDTDVCGAEKVCGLRLGAGLRGEPTDTQAR